jgi:hypothetical protein
LPLIIRVCVCVCVCVCTYIHTHTHTRVVENMGSEASSKGSCKGLCKGSCPPQIPWEIGKYYKLRSKKINTYLRSKEVFTKGDTVGLALVSVGLAWVSRALASGLL